MQHVTTRVVMMPAQYTQEVISAWSTHHLGCEYYLDGADKIHVIISIPKFQ